MTSGGRGVRGASRRRTKCLNGEKRVIDRAEFVAGNYDDLAIQFRDEVANGVVLAQWNQKAAGTLNK